MGEQWAQAWERRGPRFCLGDVQSKWGALQGGKPTFDMTTLEVIWCSDYRYLAVGSTQKAVLQIIRVNVVSYNHPLRLDVPGVRALASACVSGGVASQLAGTTRGAALRGGEAHEYLS